MRRPRVLLDCDGVLSHGFVNKVCEHLRAHGYDVQPHHCDQWDIMKAFNVSSREKNIIYSDMKREGVALSFVPIAGSPEFVTKLQLWADVFIVTSPMGGAHWAHDREQWLRKHYGIGHKQVVSVHSKFVVRGDAFVDDKLTHLVEWSREFPEGRAILFRIPPNRNDKWPIEASTYEELAALLEPLREGIDVF